jgi:LCP family protein required for cell wall assembly
MRRPPWWRLTPLAAVLALAGLIVPDSAVHPTTISLTKVESAESVDFSDDVVWLLVLGSDARPGQDVESGNTDAIQLVGLDLPSHRAAGIGIPRDSWVELPEGLDRINAALREGGPDLVSTVVADLVGITPHYVLVAGFDGFRDMVDSVGGITVRADEPVDDDRLDLHVRRGPNDLDGTEALNYARTRIPFAGGDFTRSANHQHIMMSILRRLLAREDDEGVMESGALAALQGLGTDLSPPELYRLALAITQVRPDRVTTCVLTGEDYVTVGGADVILVHEEAARRLGRDVREDARFDRGC